MSRGRKSSLSPYCPALAGPPEERLSVFVALGRASRRHGRTCAFDADSWDVTDDVVRRSGVPSRPGPARLSFGAADAGSHTFGSFLRAFVGQLPRSGHARLQTVVFAGGLIAETMKNSGVTTVAEVNAATLNAASALAAARHSPVHAARLANAVLSLGGFLHAQGLTHAPLVGTRSAITPAFDLDRADEVFEARSQRLLPSTCFLGALADAHRLARQPADIIVTRITTILLSGPGRINEALALEESPEVEREIGGILALGLRWRGSKGAADGVKWVIPAMASAVRASCEDLHQAPAEGRQIKAWYDVNPVSLYLPPSLASLRDKSRLTVLECATLLGRRPGSSLHKHVAAPGIDRLPPLEESEGAAHNVAFADLEAYLLQLLPDRMRDAGGPTTHPLLVVPWGLFNQARHVPCPSMFETVKYRHVANALGGPRGRPGPLFRRLGLDPDGEVRGRTHALRHWLITLALRGGLSAREVAEWSGHASPRESRAYDHRTAAEMRAIVSRVSTASRRTTSPLARTSRRTSSDHAAGEPTDPDRHETD